MKEFAKNNFSAAAAKRFKPALFLAWGVAAVSFAVAGEEPAAGKTPRPVAPHPTGGGAAAPAASPTWRPRVPQKETAFAGELDFSAVRLLIVQHEGRKKPLDTLARETLRDLSGRTTWYDYRTRRKIEAVDVLLSLWLRTRDWSRLPLIRVGRAELRAELHLEEGRTLFSAAELTGGDGKRVRALMRLAAAGRAKQRAGGRKKPTAVEGEAAAVISRLRLLNAVQGGAVMKIYPPPPGQGTTWLFPDRLPRRYSPAKTQKTFAVLRRFVEAYAARDAAEFGAAARELRTAAAALNPAAYPTRRRAAVEVWYNHLQPFRLAWILFLCAFVASLLASIRRKKAGQKERKIKKPAAEPERVGAEPAPKTPATGKAATALFLSGLACAAAGFGVRWWLAERPPVTNMYESILLTGFGAAFFGLLFTLLFRPRHGLTYAAFAAALPLLAADLAAPVLDPAIHLLPPVLRSRFWLLVHIVTIVLGYAALLLADVAGHVVLGARLLQRRRTGATERAGPEAGTKSEADRFHLYLYRLLQSGLFLLIAGTLLGSLWGYFAWGRLWGWDPKETWALISILCYAVALHGRPAGWWGDFGLAAAGVICFNSILMAWYGVNFVLKTGLHSYGFGGGGAVWLVSFMALDFLFVAAALAASAASAASATTAAPRVSAK